MAAAHDHPALARPYGWVDPKLVPWISTRSYPANTPPIRATLLAGSQFRYSGSHYSVLQQLMIDVTNTPFPELMQALVFAPLGMMHSSYDQTYPETRPDLTAVGHAIGGEPVPGKWRVIPEMAGAGLWTTATDLAYVACEIQRAYAGKPTKVLSKAMVDQALTPQAVPLFGLGVQLEGPDEAQRFGHGGDNIGYKCISTAYKEYGLGAVVLTNADDGYGVVLELLAAIAQEYAWPQYTSTRTRIPARPDQYAAYVGAYEVRPGFSLHIHQQEDRLYLQAADQPPVELQPSSATTFFTDVLSSDVTFETIDQEQVTGLIIRQEREEVHAKKLDHGAV
jgi:CubicO group peptidase (beta-lactamase class C family)